MNISRKRRNKAIKQIQGSVMRELRRKARREKERKAGIVRLEYADGYMRKEDFRNA